ncbi:MAG TPA: hypothetical protein VGR90_09205, partial [Acidimicrobiales bacterium]|nr:hypothetical protein [Acidimicrobiales bacterium]
LGRALDRLGHFELARSDAAGALEVRRRLAPLTSVQVNRMPAALRAEHQRWQEDRPAGVDALRRRSRQLALSLVELGEDRDATERQLLRWRYHPALAHESSEWAWRRHELAARAAQDGTPAAPGGPQPPGPKESSISTRVRTPKPVAPRVV